MKPRARTNLLFSLALATVSVVGLMTVNRVAAAPVPVLTPVPWPPLLADYVSIVDTTTLTAAGTVVYTVPLGDVFILAHVGAVPGAEVFQRLSGVDDIRVHSFETSQSSLFGQKREGPLGVRFESGSDVVLKKKPGSGDGVYDYSLIGYLAR